MAAPFVDAILHRSSAEGLMNKLAALLVAAVSVAGCATLNRLGPLVRAPQFGEAPDHRVELRLVGPSVGNPLGGASVRLWTTVKNPNPFGLTLSTLAGTLYLDDARAATTEFPLGLPLAAGGETVIPIDWSVSFAELPQLATVVRRALAHQSVDYHLDGTIGVEAGHLGTPTFGPMTLMRGTIQ